MKTIYKYILKPEISIRIPEQSQLLSVHEQNGEVCLWALVNPQNIDETRTFAVFGTGHRVPEDHIFVGTALLEGGSLVFHVFEIGK